MKTNWKLIAKAIAWMNRKYGATLEEVAHRTGKDRRTVYRWIQALETWGYKFESDGFDPTYYKVVRAPKVFPSGRCMYKT